MEILLVLQVKQEASITSAEILLGAVLRTELMGINLVVSIFSLEYTEAT
jgi:hypothetical protein